jgi:hypothetical protein
MSQHRFSSAYRVPLPTLKNWEQGRRHPDAPRRPICSPSSGGPRKSWRLWLNATLRVLPAQIGYDVMVDAPDRVVQMLLEVA